MCENCCGISRRDMIKTVAAGVVAAVVGSLAGCQQVGRTEGAVKAGPVKIDVTKIVVPPAVPAQKSEFGEIMPRRSWTRAGLTLARGDAMDGVRRITIHHSGDGKPFLGESVVDVARHLQIVQQAHLQRGMVDIAYHFAVDRAGRVWQLRWLQYEGQHVRMGKNGVRNNAHNVGIVVLGDFNRQAVTAAARDRLFVLVGLVRDQYAPRRPGDIAVSMHGDLVDTDCPGRQLRPLVEAARRRGIV